MAFVVNAFERNIHQVTAPGFLTAAAAQHNHPFAVRTLLINNVVDRADSTRLASAAQARGEIDEFVFVQDRVEEALRALHLKQSDFGRYFHWSDCCVVAMTLDGPDLLCYVDVDLELRGTEDWISQALRMFDVDPRVGVANPNWRMSDGSTSVAREADEAGPGWYKGYGFSDQIFLCRRSRFMFRLFSRWPTLLLSCPASLRYPGQHLLFGESTLFFEQIVDAFMRRNSVLRLTITSREFEPIPLSSYPTVGLLERVSASASRRVLRLLERVRERSPAWVVDPRVRTTGLLDPAFDRLRKAGKIH